MPRNMSFSLTIDQFKNRSKTVTRRQGWAFLKPGDIIMGCRKCMGLKRGEKIERLGLIRVIDIRREPLQRILSEPGGCAREGFPGKTPEQFILMFCAHMGGWSDQIVTRIQFEYVEGGQ